MLARTDSIPIPAEMNEMVLRLSLGTNRMAFECFGNKVLNGPFLGMVVPEASPWADGNASTKLLGVYEHELHEALGYALWREPEIVVNVGCAEGYYAVGLKRLLPQATVVAMDISEDCLEATSASALANGVQLEYRIGARASEELELGLWPGRRLYVVDAEGDEEDILLPDQLAGADVIVECHDFLRPGLSRRLAERFAATHRVQLISPKLPDLNQFKFVRQAPSIMSVLMLIEKRPMPCCWLACWSNRR